MTRSTSAETYNALEAKGVLGSQRYEVLLAFQCYGPGTSAEILKDAALDQNRNLARARVTELANDGRLVETGTGTCAVTGRRAIIWKAIGKDEVPVPRARPITVTTLTEDDLETFAAFKAGTIGPFSNRFGDVIDKILAAGDKPKAKRKGKAA